MKMMFFMDDFFDFVVNLTQSFLYPASNTNRVGLKVLIIVVNTTFRMVSYHQLSPKPCSGCYYCVLREYLQSYVREGETRAYGL